MVSLKNISMTLIREKKMVFKICVSAVCGDNKGMYELLGTYFFIDDLLIFNNK